jgi:hypothetical protein
VPDGGGDQLLGLIERARDRFLDEDIDPAREQVASDIGVQRCRDRDDCCIYVTFQIVSGRQGAATELQRSGLGPGAVSIHDGHQFRVLALVQDSKMVRAKRSGADDSHANFVQTGLLRPW